MLKLIKAFGHAIDGWEVGLKQRNIKIHLLATGLVILASVYYKLSAIEWSIIILLIGVVISAELLNTAIEEVCNVINDKLKLRYSETTFARDVAAGAVLMIACSSALIGLIIFVPKIFTL